MPEGAFESAEQAGPLSASRSMKRPRVAYTGEQYGFGFRAVGEFGVFARTIGGGLPGGWVSEDGRAKIKALSAPQEEADTLALRTRAETLGSLGTNSADFAVLPFYHPDLGYDIRTLQAIAANVRTMAIAQVEASDKYCLAVYEPQVLDLVQSAHPGSGLSDLMKRNRWSWGSSSTFSTKIQPSDLQGAGQTYLAGLKLDQSGQLLLRERIDTVFCGPEAARRCRAKLDGLRAAGIDVRETLETVEPHREMARLARATLASSRQTSTFYDPRDGKAHFVSTLTADVQQSAKLYGVILPMQVAMMTPDFTIVDTEIDDYEAPKTKFVIVENNPDETLVDDTYRITVRRVSKWMLRLQAALRAADGLKGQQKGVRVLLAVQRVGTNQSLGELEDYLKYFGVRFATVRLGEDSESSRPAPTVIDVEFEQRHFGLHLFHGSIARGFMNIAFSRRRYGPTKFLAVMPIGELQLPKHQQRRWWWEGLHMMWKSFGEYAEAAAALSVSKSLAVIPWLLLAGLAVFAANYLAPGFFGNLFSTVARFFVGAFFG